jgi:hypothetical protein
MVPIDSGRTAERARLLQIFEKMAIVFHYLAETNEQAFTNGQMGFKPRQRTPNVSFRKVDPRFSEPPF